MKLPIRWAVVKELRTKQPCIMAKLVHGGKLYETANVMPPNYTPAMVKLVIAAMTAEFVNAVE
jgi:hypothetical protein